MAKKCFPLLLLLTALAACFAFKTTAVKSAPAAGFAASLPTLADDELSYPTAICITETTETKGVAAEYKWLKQHYPNYKYKGSRLFCIMANDLTVAISH